MSSWFCRRLGHGEQVFKELKRLRIMRYQACLIGQDPYRLAVDTLTAETIVYFGPDDSSLANAFGATPCNEPMMDGITLLDLDFKPLALPASEFGFLSSLLVSVADYNQPGSNAPRA
ncbi:hypothetical protein SFA35_25215 (plasmid) [Pseudomonas sp. HR96]|uniref:hypothetical protein n=1 Tax=Pseudomonas sp. HR96 TaxID=1027966 RepID=UPI002A74DC3D|nr:hypothetical protein [Pseudomonas sp. HR96]WPP02360.1 hypothetical protein SFA35_25545 [Pseudomonas sp. HR96]WPP02470.1 hypothetical protein SFA35_25215 [Pseudomonas sp. HR96]